MTMASYISRIIFNKILEILLFFINTVSCENTIAEPTCKNKIRGNKCSSTDLVPEFAVKTVVQRRHPREVTLDADIAVVYQGQVFVGIERVL